MDVSDLIGWSVRDFWQNGMKWWRVVDRHGNDALHVPGDDGYLRARMVSRAPEMLRELQAIIEDADKGRMPKLAAARHIVWEATRPQSNRSLNHDQDGLSRERCYQNTEPNSDERLRWEGGWQRKEFNGQ